MSKRKKMVANPVTPGRMFQETAKALQQTRTVIGLCKDSLADLTNEIATKEAELRQLVTGGGDPAKIDALNSELDELHQAYNELAETVASIEVPRTRKPDIPAIVEQGGPESAQVQVPG